jgi:hypothetical protein
VFSGGLDPKVRTEKNIETGDCHSRLSVNSVSTCQRIVRKDLGFRRIKICCHLITIKGLLISSVLTIS